jgi:hypothetical protein
VKHCQHFCKELKAGILEEAGAAICMVHAKVSRKMEAAVSLKMVILVYETTWYNSTENAIGSALINRLSSLQLTVEKMASLLLE